MKNDHDRLAIILLLLILVAIALLFLLNPSRAAKISHEGQILLGIIGFVSFLLALKVGLSDPEKKRTALHERRNFGVRSHSDPAE